VTAEFDPATPNMARVYDYWLDGKDNYPADRAEAQRLLTIYPPLRDLVRENRSFVTHAVNWAARQGIGQFIDLGAGLPVSPSVHQAAREAMPTARVAYVDIVPGLTREMVFVMLAQSYVGSPESIGQGSGGGRATWAYRSSSRLRSLG
jgi:S-adenosyl methyltransferase